MRKLNLCGQVFTRWTVLSRTGIHPRVWACVCKCGTKRFIATGDLRSNHTKSCGCYKVDNPTGIKHGMEKSRFYMHWKLIKRRCLNKNSLDFIRYGGKGIQIHPPWLDFMNFKNDLLESYEEHFKKYGKNTTSERIDNSLGYTPSNFKWATWEEQIENKTNRIRVIYDNKIITLISLSRLLNINYPSLYYKYKNNKLSTLNISIIDKKL